MNKRLQELYLEAAEHMKKVQEQGLPAPYQTRALAGKLAELIVRECIQVGGPEDSYRDEWFEAKADSVLKIKQHFGVEEWKCTSVRHDLQS